MTDDRLALQTLLEKTPDANYLREMIGFAAQRLMELDIESHTAQLSQRSSERRRSATATATRLGDSRRNGRAAHSQAAERQLFPGFLEPRRMAEKAIAAVVQEA